MILQSIFAFNILIHVVLGAYILKILLEGFKVKSSWQQGLLVTLAVVIGMQLVTKAVQLSGLPNRSVLFAVAVWTLAGAGGFVTMTYNLKGKKLYLVSGMWGVALLVLSFLISVLDRILLFGM